MNKEYETERKIHNRDHVLLVDEKYSQLYMAYHTVHDIQDWIPWFRDRYFVKLDKTTGTWKTLAETPNELIPTIAYKVYYNIKYKVTSFTIFEF